MNRQSFRMNKYVFAPLLVIACGATIAAARPPAAARPAAQPPAPAQPKPPAAKDKTPQNQQNAAANNANIVAGLKQAYQVLAVADHDYKGHRHRAMRAIEAACRQLGSDIGGNGHGNETQPASDAQLRQAKAILLKVRDELAAAKKPKVQAHVNQAINQVTIALSVE